MSIADLLSGARPGLTPPYAPQNALPSLPPSQGAAGQKGLGGFLNRFLEPTSALGQFGRALVIAGGTPIGRAFQYMDYQKHNNADADLDRQYKQAQIAHLNAPEEDAWTKTLRAAGIDPNSEQGRAMSLSRAQHEADPIMTNVVHETGPDGQITDRLVGVPYSKLAAQFGAGAQAAPGALALPASAAPNPLSSVDDLYERVVQRESSNRPGVTGPVTPYGQAQGLSQVLPATAQSMAEAGGLDWRPDLMTGKTPEAAAYQHALGKLYLAQGFARYGGDQTKAAMFYHGGPNESRWGPKTRAYGAAVGGGPTATKQVGGKTYYRFSDGWYDNPEGR
jgi:soluble lytic murein transglycosylase-like protein